MMQSPKSNYCETKLISVCKALEKDVQKNCSFYDKSSYGDRCMFFHFDQFCDNLDAQANEREFKVLESQGLY